MNAAARPLGYGALAAYGAFGLPLACAALPLYVHLPNLYGGTLGMNLALLGALLLGVRLLDAVTDPLFGALNDRLQRPGILIAIGAALLAAGVGAAFNPAHASGSLALWLAVSLVVAYTGFSLATVSYYAWGAQLGDDAHQRTRVVASREAFGLTGVVLAAALPTALAARLDDGLARFSVVLVALTAIAVLVTLMLAPRPPRAVEAPAFGLRALAAPFGNARFVALFAVFVANGIAAALPATLVLFFINDALALPGLAGGFLAVYFIAGAAGLPLWVLAARRYGKPSAWLTSMLIAVAAFLGALALGPGDAVGFFVVCIASGLALGADLVLPPALLADLIQHRRDGARAGAYFGLWNFATKANLALAAGLALPLLEWSGYSPGPDARVAPLYFAYCLLPCALKLVAAALLWKHFSFRRETVHA